jgi:hypothetical protein
MHGKFPAIQQNQRNSILFHETIPLNKQKYRPTYVKRSELSGRKLEKCESEIVVEWPQFGLILSFKLPQPISVVERGHHQLVCTREKYTNNIFFRYISPPHFKFLA